MLQRTWVWLLVACGSLGCDAAKDQAEAAGSRTADAARAARDWAEGLRLGELSDRARGWLRSGAEASRSSIEAVLQKGQQVVPVALEIGRALASAVDGETVFEPIYQEVPGGSGDLAVRRAEADAAIRDMPRVEVIDGLSVGFKQLSRVDAGQHVSESAYLVMWRQDDRLVGFVFRSRRALDLQQLVADAPRLVALARSVL